MSWDVQFYESPLGHTPVNDYIDGLPPPARNKVLKRIRLLRELGNRLPMPHSKPLGAGLFELRTLGRGAQRLYYAFLPGRRIILLAVTPKGRGESGAIELARERMGSLQGGG